jgi:hypothetical protein
MKKPIIISILIAATVLIYFLCYKSDEGAKTKTSLLSESVPGKTAATADADNPDEEGGVSSEEASGAQTKIAGNEDDRPAQENTVTFRIQGESGVKTYKSVASFTKISVSPELTGYLGNFAADISGINLSNQSTYNNVISIMLPSDVTPGTYTERSSPFIIQFFGSENGVLYTLDHNSSFSLTIDEWGGPGGRARGTFSGELKSSEGTSLMNLRDGSFNVGIQ